MSNTIRVVARMIVIPEKVNEVKAILIKLIEPTRQESGCMAYELLHNQVDPTDFTFIEEWSSKAVLDTHLESTHIAAASDRLEGLLAAEPDIRYYKLLA